MGEFRWMMLTYVDFLTEPFEWIFQMGKFPSNRKGFDRFDRERIGECHMKRQTNFIWARSQLRNQLRAASLAADVFLPTGAGLGAGWIWLDST